MQLTISKSVYGYWNSIRGDQPVPSRSALQPGPISHLLPDLFILQWQGDGEMTFRLAGTRVSTILGTELANQPFASVWAEREASFIDALARRSALTGKPVCLDIRGFRMDYPPLAFEMVLLPLLDVPQAPGRMLGSLAPHFTSSWQLLEPVDSLRIEAMEVIDGDEQDDLAVETVPRQPQGQAPWWRRLMVWGSTTHSHEPPSRVS